MEQDSDDEGVALKLGTPSAPVEIKLTQLIDAYKTAKDNKQYALFFDKTNGNAATFFHYKARLKDFNKEIMKINQGK